MQNNSVGGAGAAGGAGATGAEGGGGGTDAAGGNQQLQGAFSTAITQAQKTLQITTEMGASLYALKQRPQ